MLGLVGGALAPLQAQAAASSVPPDPPTNVVATAGDGQATVTWTPPASDGGAPITMYRIAAQPGTVSTTVSGSETSATVLGLTNGVTYTFTVKATNADNQESAASVKSEPVVVGGGGGTVTKADPPTDVVATAGDGSASVSWTPPTNDGGSPITRYIVASQPGTDTVEVNAPSTSADFPGLTNGIPYTFTVRAVNVVGRSLPSSPSAAVTPGGGGQASAPDAPTSVVATAGDGSATVSWTAPSANGSPIRKYRVNVQPGKAYVEVTAPSTATQFDGLTNGTSYTFTVKAINDVGESAPSLPSNAVTPTATQPGPGTAGYTATTPRRVLDTRAGIGTSPAKVGAGQFVSFLVPGLPADATAVALNITATNATSTTYLTAYPAGTQRPSPFSNINVKAGQTVANLAVTRVSGNGRVSIYNQAGSVDVIADVVGHFSPTATSGHTATTPVRVLDTRSGLGAPKARIGAGRTTTVTLPGLPTGATAAVVNITATNASGRTYLTTYQTGTTRPSTSSINLVAGQTVANLAVTGVGSGRQVTIYNSSGTVDVIADLIGYYAPSSAPMFATATPARVLDTRSGLGGVAQSRIATGQSVTVTIPGLPAGATAVTLNLTATNASSGTYLVAYADGSTRPSPYSNINVVAGQTVANLAVSKVGPGGKVRIYNAGGSVDLIADLVGYYAQ